MGGKKRISSLGVLKNGDRPNLSPQKNAMYILYFNIADFTTKAIRCLSCLLPEIGAEGDITPLHSYAQIVSQNGSANCVWGGGGGAAVSKIPGRNTKTSKLKK